MQTNALNSAISEVGEAADVKFCKNCKKDITARNFTIHEVHCVRNITLCPHCDDPVAKSDLEHHITEQHTKATCPHCSAVLQKSEVDKHIADAHSTEPCPECGDSISRNLLEDHMQSMHSTTDCPLCHRVVNKADLHQHQTTDCSKRQEPCQFCSMMLAHSELAEHETYCGSRTEPCVTCGRYIMVQDTDIHRQTNCEYPAVEQKENELSADDAAAGFDWMDDDDFRGLFGHSMLRPDLPEHVRSMLENHHRGHTRLEDIFRQMEFPGPRSRMFHDSFGVRFRRFSDDPPPPYVYDNDADETRANNERATVDEQGTFADDVEVASDDDNIYDDDDVTLPCEFCKKLYVAKKLLNHQTACQLNYVQNNDDDRSSDQAEQLPHGDSQPDEQETDDYAASETDNITAASELPVDDESLSPSDTAQNFTTDDVATDSDRRPVQEETDVASSDEQTMIPCELCLELFDEHTIVEHQDDCYRQQTSALQAILGSGTTDAANRYRYPYSAMTLEDRERLGQ